MGGSIFDNSKVTDSTKNTSQQFATSGNSQQQYNPFGANYTTTALQTGLPGILGTQGYAQPYYDQSANYFGQSAQSPDISQFFNPLSGQVIAGMKDIFGAQNKQNTGNLIGQAGGVGGDRIAVGQSELARQQGLAAGQTLSQLYAPSLQAALQQRQLQQGAGAGFGQLGTAAQTAQLAPWLAYMQATGQLAPQLGGQQTGQTNQAGNMTGTENSHSTTTESPSPWESAMDVAGFAGQFFGRGGGVGGNPFASNPFARFDPRSYARGGPLSTDKPRGRYAGGGDVESFDDRWAPTEEAIASGEFDPQFENGIHWADEPMSAFAAEPRPASADVPLEGEDLPPMESSPPTAPWKPAPYESEMANPFAPQRPVDRSGLGGFLAGQGLVSEGTGAQIGNFGKRLVRASLSGRKQTAAAGAQLPLQERSLDQQDNALQMRMRQQAIEQARHDQEFAERARHNRANEDLGASRLEQENWQHLGPTEDGSGSIFLNRKSGDTKVLPIQIAGKLKPLPSGLQKDLGTQAGSYHALSSLESGFRDDYGGSTFSKVGDLQNWIARNAGLGNTDAADWWQEYQRYKNGVRHGLFGSALTANEISEWEKSDITPGMQPDRIKANIKRQRDVVEGALQRRALSLSKQGYSKEAIEAEMGIKIGAGGTPAAAAPAKKTPRTVRQNGWIFQEQPDGSMKPLQQVGE